MYDFRGDSDFFQKKGSFRGVFGYNESDPTPSESSGLSLPTRATEGTSRKSDPD